MKLNPWRLLLDFFDELRERAEHAHAGISDDDVVDTEISDITNVPACAHNIAIPRRNAASDAPIIAKLFVAAKFDFFPPVVIIR